jgi:hypothetical protein
MSANDLQELVKILEPFIAENREELKMLTSSIEKLENIRKELESEKQKYKKSFFAFFAKNFRIILCFSFLIFLVIAMPTDFKIELGQIRIEKKQPCQ